MNNDTSRYLALGDSYTIGEGVEARERWPEQLVDRLTSAGIPLGPPRIIAQTGWTTDELAAAIEQANLPNDFELVSLLIGVNNQYRGRSLSEYQDHLCGLLETAGGFASDQSARVLVLSIPDWSVTPFAASRNRAEIRESIDLFNEIKRFECQQRDIAFVDITEISRAASGNPELIASDGLHPSALMYTRWVEQAFPAAAALLQGISARGRQQEAR